MNEPRYGRSTRQADATRISTWSEPATANAGQVVRPLELAHAEKEQLLNRALDEYCHLQEQGSKVTPSQFCDRYPSYRHSLRRLIDVQDVLEGVDIDEFSWPLVGAEFMGFQLVGELGVGAIARVYLAIQPELGGRFVALKVSHGRGDEANTLGKLSHPYIVPVYSVAFDPESELNVVCMPYQGSATLADVLDLAFESKQLPRHANIILQAGGRREEFVAARSGDKKQRAAHPVLMRGSYVDGVALLGQQIAEALVYTHAQKILHRDLKPSNVLLTPDGVPKLLDFNLSIDLSSKKTRVGGTLPYMPPEQVREVHVQPFLNARVDDPRSDLFSLGVILYELLTGRLPFGDPPSQIPPREAAEAYLAQQQQPPTPIRQLNPAVDHHLATLVHRCLELEVQHRPASAQELVDSFRQHFSMLRRAKRWSRRHFLVSSATALGIFASASWGTVYLATRPAYPERLYQAGVKDFIAGRSQSAVERFTKVMELTGESNELLFARGAAAMEAGDYAGAVDDFAKVFIDPRDALAGECFAYCSAMNLDFEKAAVAYAVILQEAQGNEAQARLHVAYCDYRRGRYFNAEIWASQALELDPNNHQAYILRALARLRMAEPRKSEFRETYGPLAVADFERAIELRPADSILLCRAAQAYCLLDSFDIERLRKLLERAIDAGAARKQLLDVSTFQPWKDEAWLQDLLLRCPNTEHKSEPDWPHVLVAPDQNLVQARLTGQVGKTLPSR